MIDASLSSPLNPADLSAAQAVGRTKAAKSSLLHAAQTGDRDAVRAAAEKFEGQFLSQMLNHMMKDIGGGMFNGGQAEQIWRDIYVQEVGEVISKRGGIGVADTIERQLIQLQEVS